MSERITAQTVASHRRFIVSTLILALRAVFDSGYDRDPQFQNLKITHDFPLKELDYPCIVVTYDNRTVQNAGVGHEEWFPDANNVLRKWHHSRFEGTIDFEIHTLSPVDLDILADALTEVIRFGRLDAALLPFFTTLYGNPSDPVGLIFNQIMFDADQVSSSGNTAGLAPWSPEDLMIYQTSLTSEVHGGYYNVNPVDVWGYVTRIALTSYNTSPFDVPVVLDLKSDWSNPFIYVDDGTVIGKAKVSGTSS